MKKKDAVAFFGKSYLLAKALGLSNSTVSQWGQNVPLMHAYRLERVTNGDLRVEDPFFLDETDSKFDPAA